MLFMNESRPDLSPSKPGILRISLMALLMVTLAACASKQPGQPLKTAPSADAAVSDVAADNSDPMEALNRGIMHFNEVMDGLFIKPMAHIYLGVVPDVAQKSIKNALANLNAPVVFINSLLQADVSNAGRTLERFVVNSTAGIAGLFDVATPIGIKKEHRKDFGQTLGVWGVGQGPYVMIPVLGPSSARDTVGLVVDVLDDPFTWIFTWQESTARDVTRIIVTRADFLPLTERVYRDSLDPYATFRSIYLQHREKVVRDYLKRDAGGMEKEKTGGK
jgi:phospholipid-binding lipoprotein MlaA